MANGERANGNPDGEYDELKANKTPSDANDVVRESERQAIESDVTSLQNDVSTKAEADANVEDFQTQGAAESVPQAQPDGTLSMVPMAGGFENIQTYDSAGSYTFDATNVDKAFVEVIGAGGGSGAIETVEGDTNSSNAGGGGGYAAAMVDLSGTNSVPVTVGAGGVAGDAASTPDGGDGGNSSFGTYAEAEGGNGGPSSEYSDWWSTGYSQGGEGLTGDILIPGGDGAVFVVDGTEKHYNTMPVGGDSYKSNTPSVYSGIGLSGAQIQRGAGKFPGGGASGMTASGTTYDTGWPGADGMVIVWY